MSIWRRLREAGLPAASLAQTNHGNLAHCRNSRWRIRVMLSTVADYQRISNDMSRSLSITATKPDVSRETAYYLANIGKVTSVDGFLKDYRLFSYAMKAYGLSDMVYAKAFMRKVLTEGTQNSDSFANKLSDPRYREFANTFNFALLGSNATHTSAAQAGTAQQYVRQVMEEDAGNRNDGVRLALYFARKASSIKNPFQILADKALTQVVQTALGVSPTTSAADIDKQAAMLSKLITFSDFQDPAKVSKFTQRFAAMWDTSQDPSTAGASSSVPQMLIGQSMQNGIDLDTLTKLQTLRFGK
jgi:hypothetical protein